MNQTEIVFDVRDAREGGYIATARDHAIATQGEDWDGLRRNIEEATALFFEDEDSAPESVRLVLRAQHLMAVA